MATLRQVERFTVTFSGTSTTKTLSTTLLDTTKAFMVFGIEEGSDSPQYGQVRGTITNTTTLTFNRQTSDTNNVVVVGYVIEFTAGVTVQRGSQVLTGDTTTVNLNSLDLTKSFRTLSYQNAGSAYGNDDFIRSRIYDDAGTKKIEFNLVGGSVGTVDWQVIEYDNCSVQRDLVDLAINTTSITDSITTVNRSRAWLNFDYKTASGAPGYNMIRGQINTTTQLTFDKNTSSGTNVDGISWEVIEFTDTTSVQEIFESFVATDAEEDQTITQVAALDRAFACTGGHMNRGGKSNYNTTDYQGNCWFTCDLTTTTNLKTKRGATQGTGDAVIYVISFPKVVDQEGFRFRNDDGDEDEATWKAAQDTNITISKNSTVRLRILLDAEGDPAACTYQLEYKETSDGAAEWTKVDP